jgi:hypothetical protein
MIVDHGIILLKYWLEVSEDVQRKRFQESHQRPGKAVEAVADRPAVAGALVRLFPRTG